MKILQKHAGVLRIAFLTALFGILATNGFAAGDADTQFGRITGIVESGSQAGATAFGTGLIWAVSVFVPLICVGASAFMGYTFAKKKAEQQGEGEKKIFTAVFIAVGIGVFVYIFLVAILGAALLGEVGKIFDHIFTFYGKIFEAGLGQLN